MSNLALMACAAFLLMVTGSLAQTSGPVVNPLERYQESLKQSQLAPVLGVDQATVHRLLDIDRRYKAQKMQMLREMKDDLQRLRQLLNQPSPPEEEVRQLLNLMFQKRQNTLNLQQQQLQEEMAILTPVQQGRYLLFLISLRHQMANEARGLRGGPHAPGVRGIPVVQPSR